MRNSRWRATQHNQKQKPSKLGVQTSSPAVKGQTCYTCITTNGARVREEHNSQIKMNKRTWGGPWCCKEWVFHWCLLERRDAIGALSQIQEKLGIWSHTTSVRDALLKQVDNGEKGPLSTGFPMCKPHNMHELTEFNLRDMRAVSC